MNVFFKDIEHKLRIKKYTEVIGDDGESYYEPTPEWKDYKARRTLEIAFDTCSLPPHVIDLTLEDYIGPDRDKLAKLQLYVDKFGEKFKSVHLYFLEQREWYPEDHYGGYYS